MPDLRLRINKDMLVVAPLVTLGLFDESLDGSECLEYFNILDEDVVRETHRRFRAAGAECVLTNTLEANRQGLAAFGLEDALQDINRAGVQLAREAGFEHILAVVKVAPTEHVFEQVEALLIENPDAFFLVADAQGDDAQDAAQGDAALLAAIEAIRQQTQLPVFAPLGAVSQTVSTEEADTYLMAQSLDETLRLLNQAAQRGSRPVMVCPDPGTPSGSNEQQQKMAQSKLVDGMVDFALEAREKGVQFIGTAPGSSPVFTGAISAAISGLDVVA